MKKYSTAVIIALLITPIAALAAGREILIDAVVASVDGRPITLSEISDRMQSRQRLTLTEASENSEARMVLDQIIMERIIQSEAQQKRVGVGEGEVDAYLNEVAARNDLSRPEFEKALKAEGKDLKQYKQQVEVDILKSKIAGSMVRSGVGVTDEEVEEFIKNNPSLNGSGTKVKLSQIFISNSNHSEEEAMTTATGLSNQLDDGADFAKLAAEYSESPEGKDGGSLGVISEGDLSSFIYEAILPLEEGETSDPTKSSRGVHIFLLEEKFVDDSDEADEALEEEVRQVIKQQKLENLMRSYFTVEVFKNHSVDKKI